VRFIPSLALSSVPSLVSDEGASFWPPSGHDVKLLFFVFSTTHSPSTMLVIVRDILRRSAGAMAGQAENAENSYFFIYR
jgi:hypothetical protein